MPISLVISRGKNGGGYSPEDTMRFVDDEGRNEPRQLGYLRAHEGGGRQDETVEHLKHEIKRLSEQLERMGKGGSKRDKGLEEVVAGAERIMPELILDAAEVVENPPKTWDKYLKEGKTADIIRMEGKEFMTAIEKAESVEHFLKEATHTLAAVMLFCAEK